MTSLNTTVIYQNRKHRVKYTRVRARIQRSTDGGSTWEDVYSENLPLGAQPPAYPVPADAPPGKYRVGLALTNGVSFGAEAFSNVVSVPTTPTTPDA